MTLGGSEICRGLTSTDLASLEVRTRFGDGLRWDEDEWVTSVSSPVVALRYVLPGRTVESVSPAVPVPVLSPIFSSKKAISSPVRLGTLTGELTRSMGSVAARKWDEWTDRRVSSAESPEFGSQRRVEMRLGVKGFPCAP